MRYIAFIEAPSPGHRSGNWSAFFPDVMGCVATGKTFEQTTATAREALTLHIAGLVEDGDSVPPPRTMQELLADPQQASALMQNGGSCVPQIISVGAPPSKRVRVNITIDERLLSDVDESAERQGITRSRMIEDALQAALAA